MGKKLFREKVLSMRGVLFLRAYATAGRDPAQLIRFG